MYRADFCDHTDCNRHMSVVGKWAIFGHASVNRRPDRTWPKFILDPNKLWACLLGNMHSNLDSQGTVFLCERQWGFPSCTFLMDTILLILQTTQLSVFRIYSLIQPHSSLRKLHRQALCLERISGHRGNPLLNRRGHIW